MSTSVNFNSSSYTVPSTGEEDWGGASKVDGLLISLAQNALSKAGGAFTLTAEVDFGGTAGLKSLYIKSRGTNTATAGIVRLANAEAISWRNAANSANIDLAVDSSNRLTFSGAVIFPSSIGAADTVYTSDGTNVVFQKIVNANVDSSAAIARTKLASGTNYRILANNGSGVMGENAALTSSHVVYADANGQLAGEATLSKSRGGSGQDNSSITFPASGTLATLAGTENLSNKTFTDSVTLAEVSTPSTPSSGNGKIYFKTDGFLYQLNDDGTETKVGAGSGGINYISNPDFESSVSGWVAYADAADTSPVDGTGGSPTVTITRSTSSPLRGTANGLITKDAANRQGQGVSYDFTIASADKAKMLNVSFEYAGSANMAVGDSSDVRVWVYDVTNAALIAVTPYTLQGGTGYTWKFNGQFQSASNSISYRLILHIATANSSAWTMQLDTVVVGPTIQIIGAPVTDWQSYTSVITGTSSNPTKGTTTVDNARWRRDGDSMEIIFSYIQTVAGSAGSGSYLLALPTGYSIDTTKVSVGTNADRGVVGSCRFDGSATSPMQGVAQCYDSTRFVFVGTNATTSGNWGSSNADLGQTSCNFSCSIRVPILGWGSSVTLSSDTDTRVVTAKYFTNAGQSLANNSFDIVNFEDVSFDTHAAVTVGASWKFTAPVSGYYKAVACVTLGSTGSWTAGERMVMALHKNGTLDSYIGDWLCQTSGTYTARVLGSGSVYLNAGQYLDVRVRQDTGVSQSLDTGSEGNFIAIERLSGPATIAASESVNARVTGNPANATDGNPIIWPTALWDTHGSYSVSTGLYTVPTSGKYQVCGAMVTAATSGRTVYAYVDSSADSFAGAVDSNGNISFCTIVRVLAGQTISLRPSGGALDASGGNMSIARIGNY